MRTVGRRMLAAWTMTLMACTPQGSDSPTGAGEPDPTSVASWKAEVETWQAERVERLRQPDGWLTLVGLDWLESGDNVVGSAEGSVVRLPASTPARLGVITLGESGVTLAVEAGQEVEIGDGPTGGTLPLATDASGDATVVRLGSVQFHVIERQGRFAVRIKDSQAPALLDFDGLDFYPFDPSLRVVARFEAYEPAKSLAVPSVLGGTNAVDSPGAVVFEVDGQEHRIDALPGGADGSLFLVFGDATNGSETYGGGRFLYTDPPADGTVVVDFNRAYSPPCIFTPYATCPLPTPENKMAVALRAGEKTYTGVHHG